MALLKRIANVFRPDRVNTDLDEEYASHIEEAILAGRDPAEARRALGNLQRQREESHSARVVGWLDSLRADLVFGWRQLRRNLVTSVAAILSLALAIGACTTAFRLIDALLWRPLPVAHPERLYVVSRAGMGFDNKPGEWDSWAYPCFQLMREAVKGQAELIAVSYTDHTDITYKTDQEMEKAVVQNVSGWMFGTFGLQPAAGRLFTEADDRTPKAAPYAVLSYDYWTRRFGRDPSVIGRSFHFGNDVYQIVGVSEKKFTGTEPGVMVDIFFPTMMHGGVTKKDWTWFRTIVVAAPGAQIDPIRARLDAISHDFEKDRLSGETGLSQETLRGVLNNRVRIQSAQNGASQMQKDYDRALAAIGVLVVMVLLIACANVANLMTARAAARSREMALRISIGAGRARLVRLVLAESVMLAVASAIGGALFTLWSAPFVVSMLNGSNGFTRLVLPADWRVLAFGFGLIVCVVGFFGLAPALRASSIRPVAALKGDEPHSRRFMMNSLIAVQVAFCFLVLFVAGLFMTTFEKLSHKPIGFSAERILLLESMSRHEQPAAYWDQVETDLRQMPGVEHVAQSAWPLLSGSSWNDSIALDGGQPSADLSDFYNVSPGWFETMKLPLLAGRDFRPTDSYPHVAVVNQTFARKFLHDDNPIGRVFEKTGDDGKRTRIQVIGLVADAYLSDIRTMKPVVYVPIHNGSTPGDFKTQTGATFTIRTAAKNSLVMASQLRAEIKRIRPEILVSNVSTQRDLLDAQTIRERLLAMLAFFFGVVALLLAGIGLYGVLFYTVIQSEREIGIRIALGARAMQVLRPVTRGILIAFSVGTAAGLLLGLGSARYIESLLYEVKGSDPAQLLAPGLVLLTAAIAAAVPALIRAMRVNPVDLLRAQ